MISGGFFLGRNIVITSPIMPEDEKIERLSAPIPAKSASAKPDECEYTAFEKWRYSPIIYKSEHKQSWHDLADSFFYASHALVNKIADREYGESEEGLAAIFL